MKKIIEPIVDWRTLNLQSLDGLACSGYGKLSQQIEWLQRLRGIHRPAADLSHWATLVKIRDIEMHIMDSKGGEIKRFDPNELYVTETTTLNSYNGKKGLQINGFSEWLENYNGRVWVRKVDFDRTEQFQMELIKYIFKHLRDPNAKKYENGIPGLIELILCELGIKKAILETAELHCTEWGAELLKWAKVLADAISNNRMPPCEWWPEVIERLGNIRVSLLDMYMLVPIGEPIRIK